MKKIFSFITTALLGAFCLWSCSGDDSSTQCSVVDFEGDYFSSLIDAKQNGGELINGAALYAWTDEETLLTDTIEKVDTSATRCGKCVWVRGTAISNYVDADPEAGEDKRLSVPSQYLSGGNNFIVIYNDSSQLSFADGKAHIIEQLALSPTTYLLNYIKKNSSDQFNFIVTVIGTKIDGTFTMLDLPIAKGKSWISGWVIYPYLSALGPVTTLTFIFAGSDLDENKNLKTPKYIALDNIVVDI